MGHLGGSKAKQSKAKQEEEEEEGGATAVFIQSPPASLWGGIYTESL